LAVWLAAQRTSLKTSSGKSRVYAGDRSGVDHDCAPGLLFRHELDVQSCRGFPVRIATEAREGLHTACWQYARSNNTLRRASSSSWGVIGSLEPYRRVVQHWSGVRVLAELGSRLELTYELSGG
jgi:hypothetical protein